MESERGENSVKDFCVCICCVEFGSWLHWEEEGLFYIILCVVKNERKRRK